MGAGDPVPVGARFHSGQSRAGPTDPIGVRSSGPRDGPDFLHPCATAARRPSRFGGTPSPTGPWARRLKLWTLHASRNLARAFCGGYGDSNAHREALCCEPGRSHRCCPSRKIRADSSRGKTRVGPGRAARRTSIQIQIHPGDPCRCDASPRCPTDPDVGVLESARRPCVTAPTGAGCGVKVAG